MPEDISGAGLLEAGRLAAARVQFWAEAAAAEVAEDGAALARAALGLGGLWVNEHRSTLERARVLALQQRALHQPGLDASLALRLRARLAAERAYGDHDATGMWPELEAARRTGDPIALAECLSLAHHCLLGPHFGADRLALADELIGTAALTGRKVDALMGLLWRTVDLFLAGDRRAGRSLRELQDQLAADRCDALRYVAAAIEVMITLRNGDLDAAEAEAERCYQLGVEVGDADALGWFGAQLVALRWLQGRGDELLPMLVDLDQSTTVAEGNEGFTAAIASLAAAAGDEAMARRALTRLRLGGLDRLAPSSSWLATVTGAVEAAYLLGDTEVAATAYPLLLPFADHPVMASLAVACYGSAQRPLGLAAATLGDLDLAVAHLEAAVEADLALGNEPCRTISRASLADTLDRRGRDDDAARARILRDGAIADATRLGMTLRAERWAAQAPSGRRLRLTCTRQGQLWTIEDGERLAVVPDCVGMDYLSRLIASPDIAVPAVELAGAQGVFAARQSRQPLLDVTAREQYRQRAEELKADIDDAERCADLGRAAGARDELEVLVAELEHATGLAGRQRVFTDTPERARTSVRKALRRALNAVAAADEELAHQLETRLITGTRCTFVSQPPAASPVRRAQAC